MRVAIDLMGFTVYFRTLFLCAVLAVIFTACVGASGPHIRIHDPWVRAAKGGSNSAAYLTIQNTGSDGDRLITVKSDVVETLEIHLSEIKDNVMTMHQA